MTDKQIIIDGTKCPWFNDGSCDLFYSDKEECWYRQCKDTPNCYYRKTQTELKRKEQECEDLREDIKDIANLLDLDTGEEYNFGNIELEIKQLKTKEKECEWWKEEIISRNEKIEELRFSVSDLTNRLCDLNAEKSFRIVDLEQTLTEIKEIAEPYYTLGSKYTPVAQILQKISECEVKDV